MPTKKPHRKKSKNKSVAKKRPRSKTTERSRKQLRKKPSQRKKSVGATKKPSQKRRTKTKPSLKKVSQRRQLPPASMVSDLRQALPSIEQCCYWDLSPTLKKLVNQFWKPKGDIPSIRAWTFVLHPSLINGSVPGRPQLKRYI